MEIKNKLTVTKGVGRGGKWVKKGKGHQGTCIKDPWTKTMGGGLWGGLKMGSRGG